jgi:hypothetical protein
MIGDNLRRTTIRPKNPLLDIFYKKGLRVAPGITSNKSKA